jgi:hypothetical protein
MQSRDPGTCLYRFREQVVIWDKSYVSEEDMPSPLRRRLRPLNSYSFLQIWVIVPGTAERLPSEVGELLVRRFRQTFSLKSRAAVFPRSSYPSG